MGVYVYKITANRVKLEDGTEANVAVFAYKDHFWDSALVARMRRKSACYVAERFAESVNYTGRVVMGSLSDDGKFVHNCSTAAWEMSNGTFVDNEAKKVVGKPVFVNADNGGTVALVKKSNRKKVA